MGLMLSEDEERSLCSVIPAIARRAVAGAAELDLRAARSGTQTVLALNPPPPFGQSMA